MVEGNLSSSLFTPLLPQVLLLILGIVIMALDLILHPEDRRNLGWAAAAGCGLILLICLATARPVEGASLLWGGMLRHDWLGFIFQMAFIFGAGVTALFAMNQEDLQNRGEFYLLLIVATIGMNLLATSADLIMLYLAIETTSIPMYVLAGFLVRDRKSTEAGFKYLLFGALTSAVMLYGFTLLYGFSRTTNMYQIAEALVDGNLPTASVIGSFLLVLVGFGFKISAAPFHFWAPDVYEGAPTPVAGFLSTASKAAGFAVLLRFLWVVFPDISEQWGAFITAISVTSMTLGNLVALAQKNIKRLLAYSSIAHAGYALIGVVSLSDFGIGSVVFYLAAFGVVAAAGRVLGSDEISAYSGLSRRSPGLALAMLVAFLSLAGMPPLGGFIVKFLVFAAAVQAGLVWLAFVGVLNSIVGLYYYLTVLKVVYLYRSENDEQPLTVPGSAALALGVLVVGIVLLGVVFAPWFNWAAQAAGIMFG